MFSILILTFHSVHPLDVIPLVDYQVATVCFMPRIENDVDECRDAFNAGFSLISKEILEKDGGPGRRCRRFVHSIETFVKWFADDNNIFENGTTKDGCMIPSTWGRGGTLCPIKPSIGAGYVFLWITFVALIAGFFILIGIGIYALIRCIYLKKKGRDGYIFPCTKDRLCCCCTVGTI